jgi:hypothetical protein
MVKEWLISGMLKADPNANTKADSIIKELGDHALTKSHVRHISASKCEDMGLNIEMLEANQDLQDAVLTVHHACIHTLSSTPAFKIKIILAYSSPHLIQQLIYFIAVIAEFATLFNAPFYTLMPFSWRMKPENRF